MASKNPSSAAMDFRAADDAWYGVRRLLLLRHDDTLVVKYCDFPDDFDDHFHAGSFKTAAEVDDFAERFRRTSVQLQDHQCSRVIEGVRVCVSYSFSDSDIKFYNAIVEEANFKDHVFKNGEEVCTCDFVVFWEHGPNAGNKASTSVENICLIQPQKELADPALLNFLKISREKVRMAACDSSLSAQNDDLLIKSGSVARSDGLPRDSSSVVKNDGLARDVGRNDRVHSTTDVKMKTTLTKSSTSHVKEAKTFKQSSSMGWTYEGQHNIDWKRSGQDVDLGGKTSVADNVKNVGVCHFVLIENLEKDLAPSTIEEFIKRHISIACQAHVYPCLSSETYTRGIISVESQEKLLKLYNFLRNPAHMILSSRGRPWVITEKNEVLGAVLGNLKSDSKTQACDTSLKYSSKLRIATLVTDEYKRGKQLMKLFVEFAGHMKHLHKSLASQERKIMQT
ncbi:hypothetical protein Sjap_003839 [Stephania japonica]|uniref:SAWADEE domain-containing protein n=1 Tax=Stephania japonica TaxID=461633 RepID=A0AAP0KRZ8_9MAGN